MKKLFTLFLAVLTTINIFSQAPEKMSYQAVIRNSSNELVVSSTVGMRISILQGSAEGTVVYTETQTPVTNANGLVSIEIGGGEGFSSIDWSTGTYFIKTETDPLGGSSYTIMGTSQLLSVPYALYAKTADNVEGLLERIKKLEGVVYNQLPIPTDGLVGYWSFTGNANDSSGNNHHGTVNGATITTDRFGNANGAYSFDGVNDYIDLGNSSVINSTIDGSFSISIWYKTNNALEQRLFEKRDFGYKGFLIATWGNQVGFWIGDGSTSTYHTEQASVFNQDVWNHYVCVIDKSQRKVYSYLNGVLVVKVADISQINNIISNTQPARIGINVALQGSFLGKLDDLRVYNRALSNSEIKSLYHENGW